VLECSEKGELVMTNMIDPTDKASDEEEEEEEEEDNHDADDDDNDDEDDNDDDDDDDDDSPHPVQLDLMTYLEEVLLRPLGMWPPDEDGKQQ
jgi:hypothetical protein